MRLFWANRPCFAPLFHKSKWINVYGHLLASSFLMKNLVLKFGLISGAVSGALVCLTAYFIKKNGIMAHGELYGYAGMILSMLFVFLGVRVYRDRECNGRISFGEALKVGGLIALISCVCYAITWLFVSKFMMPDFMDQYITFYLNKMKSEGAAEAEIQKAVADMEYYKTIYANPFYRTAMIFMEPMPVAAFVSVVSAAVLRKS